jgi:hypothetical protein
MIRISYFSTAVVFVLSNGGACNVVLQDLRTNTKPLINRFSNATYADFLNLIIIHQLSTIPMQKLLVLFCFAMAFFSCDKNQEEIIDTGLIGKWGLIEVLADPGDGSGTFHSVQSSKIVEFHNDGTITSNGTICDMSIDTNNPSSGTYSLADSTISSTDCNTNMMINFEQSGTTLIINYPCIEPCRAKFKKKQPGEIL